MSVKKCKLALGVALLLSIVGTLVRGQQPVPKDLYEGYDWQVPNQKWMTPFKDEVPIYFVGRSQNLKEWNTLKSYWNEATEKAFDPLTGAEVMRRVMKIKVPLGLNQGPPVPAENPMTVARWSLGRDLYFDPVLSSDGTVSCALLPRSQEGLHRSVAGFHWHQRPKRRRQCPDRTERRLQHLPILGWPGQFAGRPGARAGGQPH